MFAGWWTAKKSIIEPSLKAPRLSPAISTPASLRLGLSCLIRASACLPMNSAFCSRSTIQS
jgi:hypothetical protein